MNCSECREILSAMLDGEAMLDEVAAVESHTGGCPDCKSFRAHLDTDRERLEQWPDEIPGDAELGRVLKWASRSRGSRRWLAAAASLLLAVSAGFLAGRLSGEPTPLPEPEAPRHASPVDQKRFFPDTNESYAVTVLAQADPAALHAE